MPCCTLIAFILSQPALLIGAIKARLFGEAHGVASAAAYGLHGWKLAGLAGMLAVELTLGFGAAPYLITHKGRVAAEDSTAHVWRLCSFDKLWRAAR
jgi:hypothetical protein